MQGRGSLKWAAFSTPTERLSERGGVLAVVVRGIPETQHWKRDKTVIPGTLRQSKERLRRGIGVPVVGATRLFGAGSPSGRERWCTAKFTISPPLWDSSTVIPREGSRIGQETDSKNCRTRMTPGREREGWSVRTTGYLRSTATGFVHTVRGLPLVQMRSVYEGGDRPSKSRSIGNLGRFSEFSTLHRPDGDYGRFH